MCKHHKTYLEPTDIIGIELKLIRAILLQVSNQPIQVGKYDGGDEM
jgi:hypothetical protein